MATPRRRVDQQGSDNTAGPSPTVRKEFAPPQANIDFRLSLLREALPVDTPSGPTTLEWSKTLSEGIVDQLRTAIVNGEYPPGFRLIETDVATKFQVSLAPIREAFKVLEHEGLLTHQPRRGTFVASISKKDWREIYSLRNLLENFAYRLMAQRIDEGDIRDLQAIVDQMRHAATVAEVLDLDNQFHNYLIARTGHARLVQEWRNLDQLMGAIFALVMRERLVDIKEVGPRHQQILDAFASRSVEVVEDVLNAHYFIADEGGSDLET